MTFLSFIVALVILGIIFYLIEQYVPMSPPFKAVTRIVGILILIYMILSLFHYVPIRF